jgi:hypothetical protein
MSSNGVAMDDVFNDDEDVPDVSGEGNEKAKRS